MKNVLADLPARHYRDGAGIPSVCSAHPMSLEAGVAAALRDDAPLLIEATSNQVDQFGGYTGMVPAAFRKWVEEFAAKLGLPAGRLILGGDHLGPNPWRKEPAAEAMDKARELVRQYVAAGFTKIHLDCSMALGGDAGAAPSQEVVATRAAELCRVAEDAAKANGGVMPVYVVGTEVPIPGGVTHDIEATLEVTSIADAEETLETHRRVFAKAGLDEAWSRVIAMVVQPGVEFGNYTVAEYDREKARALSQFIAKLGDILFEAHSTDYQTQRGLNELVEDHYAVLKVGPWLTYAYREAVYALDAISRELGGKADVRGTVESVMLESPQYWQGHYHGTEAELRLARVFSFSDRVRYYWPNARIAKSVESLMAELSSREIPLSLLCQYLPAQYGEVRNRLIPRTPHALAKSAVLNVMTMFSKAAKTFRG
jgi:D-tagatose-1,6-bisphosphate aldolase subunit GatZ/KbaZ